MAAACIVYIDDDIEMTGLVSGALEDVGYEVLTANDGEEGLEMILTECPDLIILDVIIPKLNGWEIARYLRSHKKWVDTPVLMLTGIGPALNEMTAPLYGANDQLDKPFEMEELIEKVGALLGDEAVAST